MLELSLQVRRKDFHLQADLETGEGVTALMGPSGSGKTTLLHALAGLVPEARGRLVLDGRVLLDTKRGVDLPPRRRGLGVVFQDLRLFPHLSVDRNLRYGAGRSGPDGPTLEQVVELLELEPLMERRPDRLSGGQARRVALGRALLSRPRMLLLDEPLAGLDRELAAKLLPYLDRVRRVLEIPALYVSHDPGEALALADHAVVLREGRVVARGRPEVVLHEEAVFPLTRVAGWENVFRGRVLEASGEGARVRVGEGELEVAGQELEPGERVLVCIRARDLVLAGDRAAGLSVRNQLAAEVEEVHPLGERCLVYLRAGARWIAEVTPTAAREMGLVPGGSVHLLVKSSAIEVLRAGEETSSRPAAVEEGP